MCGSPSEGVALGYDGSDLRPEQVDYQSKFRHSWWYVQNVLREALFVIRRFTMQHLPFIFEP